MTTVTEAKQIIREASAALPPCQLPLLKAAGCVLAEDIFAGQDHPHFDQAAMDGYAFCFEDFHPLSPLRIKGESAAGTTQLLQAGKQEAVRIFTGAPVPAGTDTVVMQEKVLRDGDTILIQDETLRKGGNVRPAGSEIGLGDMALEKGSRLTPAAIGFLASLGKIAAPVISKPQIEIIVTGSELQSPGHPLQYGQVYESNSYSLQAALHQLKLDDVAITKVHDNSEAVQRVIEKKLAVADLVLISGGVSTGDYDFVAEALAQCGVDKLFHKLKQKPGKPLYFGKRENTLVFGLPGNPSSVLTCFYEYVTEALQVQLGLTTKLLPVSHLPLAAGYVKKAGLTHFLKGVCSNDAVVPLHAQESYRLRSFALADCLIVLDEEKTKFEKGELVEVHHIPV